MRPQLIYVNTYVTMYSIAQINSLAVHILQTKFFISIP